MIALLISAEQVIVYDVEHGTIAPVGTVDPDALCAAYGRVLQVRPPTEAEAAELAAFGGHPLQPVLEPWSEVTLLGRVRYRRLVAGEPDDWGARVFASGGSYVGRIYPSTDDGETSVGRFADAEEAKIACDLAWLAHFGAREPEQLTLDQIRKLGEGFDSVFRRSR